MILCHQIDEDLQRYDSTKDPMILDSITYRLDLLHKILMYNVDGGSSYMGALTVTPACTFDALPIIPVRKCLIVS